MHALLHAIIGGCGVDLPKSGVAMADRLPSLAWPTLAKRRRVRSNAYTTLVQDSQNLSPQVFKCG